MKRYVKRLSERNINMWNVWRISILIIYTAEESKLAANGIKSITSFISGMRKRKIYGNIFLFSNLKNVEKIKYAYYDSPF